MSRWFSGSSVVFKVALGMGRSQGMMLTVGLARGGQMEFMSSTVMAVLSRFRANHGSSDVMKILMISGSCRTLVGAGRDRRGASKPTGGKEGKKEVEGGKRGSKEGREE